MCLATKLNLCVLPNGQRAALLPPTGPAAGVSCGLKVTIFFDTSLLPEGLLPGYVNLGSQTNTKALSNQTCLRYSPVNQQLMLKITRHDSAKGKLRL